MPSARKGLPPGGWCLEDTAEGWHFRFQPVATMSEVLAERDVAWALFIIGLLFIRLVPLSRVMLERYFDANRTRSVEAHGSVIDTDDGQFEARLLDTARLTQKGALPGRWLVVFSGHVIPEAQLVGWPGVPRDTAESILAAVRTRTSRGTSARTGC